MSDELTYEELCVASDSELERLLIGGFLPELDELAGWEFRGYNTGQSAELIRARKFKKGFHRDPADPHALRGYNVVVRQNGLPNPWIEVLRHGEPIRHALYLVHPVRPGDRDSSYPRALLLDYGRGHNPPLHPARALRDYVARIYRHNTDLYLGKAYGAIGRLRIPLGYFVLERYNQVLD
jgi:hypothetical protein